MKEIIVHLDNYLTRTGRKCIDPVEANAILAKAGLLRDSKDRPGKPLRDLLRNGKLPHAYQPGGKGSSWVIPHSNKRNLITITNKPIDSKIKKIKPSITLSHNSTSGDSIAATELMYEKNFKSAGSIENLVPQNSGIYCIRISDINKLPKPFNTILASREHNII